MPETTIIAHLSDVHVTPPVGLSRPHFNMKRTLGLMNWHRGRKHVHRRDVLDEVTADMLAMHPQHVVVTGDLCNIGLPAEYAAALSWLETLGAPDNVSVVPGNHDIYSRLHAHQGVQLWRAYMASDPFGEALPGIAATPLGFPYVRRIGHVALIGVNSAIETPPFVAAGEVGDRQLDALERLLGALASKMLARVVLIHHPPLPGLAPPSRGLADAGKLEAVLARTGAELVLHGHNHRDMINWCTGPDARIPVIGIASGSAGRRHRNEPMARYNLIRIRRVDDAWVIEVTGRGLVTPAGSIVELDRHVLTPMAA